MIYIKSNNLHVTNLFSIQLNEKNINSLNLDIYSQYETYKIKLYTKLNILKNIFINYIISLLLFDFFSHNIKI
jgi:hypothetical protein